MKTMKKLTLTDIQQINGGCIIGDYWNAFKSSLQDLADRVNPWIDHTPES